ncbi:hypothetical protein M409DRAFT_18569 [Zasmidium cellare ATCC 36951]|uniref:GST N-terminal domain-containing protein n=1 Tax=Zasmidium cellare ATCC 36951 TaxID=1080233 RepID=A0A6A6CZX5_ZASCE|nr:uncharacterized protein M409DRAFT_18569 [Zasmidium cellare ATCC 36951]KAF2171452.1 hypothetical protein M409DRAFT_18569 [Zasmidium cellare ATCC 36951]
MASQEATHVLYHFEYSICSIMVRYAFALRGPAVDEDHEIILEEQPVDIVRSLEQMSEHFLCDVNANGEVPVLVPLKTGEPLPDSVAITKYLAKSYPSMIPEPHKEKISQLLHDLHRISFFGFTFAGKPQTVGRSKGHLHEILDGDISDRYRAAIEYKLQRLDSEKASALTPEATKKNEEYTKELVAKLESLLQTSRTSWLFDLERPSALDAHLVVFIARMLDIGRGDVIPAALRAFAEKAMSGSEWQQVMQDRSTCAF